MTPRSAFQRVCDVSSVPQELRGGVVAIGNFDGVHRGHQAVLARAIAEGTTSSSQPVIALTFEPHPRSVFKPDQPVARITPAPMRAAILANAGLDGVIEIPFTRDFASLSADDFVDQILVSALGARHVVTGFDFHFGRNRQGGPAYLMDAGDRRGFAVSLVDALRDDTINVISSSRIRTRLADGALAAANDLLGYRFRVNASIIKGKQLGRTLGYPTANMQLADNTPLAHGIYAVRFHGAAPEPLDGVASFGRRPTVDTDGAPLLETYIFDYESDLYGRDCTVSLCHHLRGEAKFDNLDALTVQMQEDEQQARAFLSTMSPLSNLDHALTFAADG